MKYNLRAINRATDKELRQEMITRYCIKKTKKKRPARPIKSMQDEWRIFSSDRKYGESWYEVGFFEAKDLTDEEIEEYVDDMREYCRSPYDCSGETFTQWIEWHRNPCGLISVIHKKAINI